MIVLPERGGTLYRNLPQVFPRLRPGLHMRGYRFPSVNNRGFFLKGRFVIRTSVSLFVTFITCFSLFMNVLSEK